MKIAGVFSFRVGELLGSKAMNCTELFQFIEFIGIMNAEFFDGLCAHFLFLQLMRMFLSLAVI
jgi:hypothetical protein